MSASTPQAASPAAVAACRSLSFSLSSDNPAMRVSPSAKAATAASTGYSSIMEGARSAGTCTPLALAVLSTRLAVVMLSIVWAAAIVGVTIKLAGWRRADRAASAMYITNGWAGTMLIPAMASNGQWTALVLLMAGGLVYTFGALGFARQWPTLRPHVFSFHEVWHLCTLAAAAAHFIAIWSVIG